MHAGTVQSCRSMPAAADRGHTRSISSKAHRPSGLAILARPKARQPVLLATRATGGGSEENDRDAANEISQEKLQSSGTGGDVASRFRESMTEAKLKNVY